MLITDLRAKFRFYSDPELIDNCFSNFGLTFIVFTRILYNSHKFDAPIEDNENRKKTFNLANWKVKDKQLVNPLMNLTIPIPQEYLT